MASALIPRFRAQRLQCKLKSVFFKEQLWQDNSWNHPLWFKASDTDQGKKEACSEKQLPTP